MKDAMDKGQVTDLIRGIFSIADSVVPYGSTGIDHRGKPISSLVEAGMSMSAGLTDIAYAINNLAAAVRGEPEP